jgi:outer membrane protein OmpA-like peptidoglycan-associated protein
MNCAGAPVAQRRFFTLFLGSVLWLGVLIWAGAAAAQEPPDAVPQDAKRQILDLKFVIQDLGGKNEALGGKIESLQVKETATEIRIELAADVLFDFDKADILPKAATTLKQAAAVIREKGKGTVRIDGYTDSKGSDAYNQRLSARRADSVKNWLVAREGLKDVRFVAEGFGSKRPVAPNTKPDGSDDPEGRQKNRRVEIIVQKQ